MDSTDLPLPAAERRRAVVASGYRSDATAARRFLADPDQSVRCLALGALARAGELDRHDLARGLTDPSPAVRRRAVELAIPDPATSLLSLLDDDDAGVAEAAAWACGERHPPEPGVVDRLARLARHHTDPIVRESAVAALGAIGDPGGLEAVLAATRDRPAIRRRAVIGLAPFSGPEVTAALERARYDRDRQVRQAAEDLLA